LFFFVFLLFFFSLLEFKREANSMLRVVMLPNSVADKRTLTLVRALALAHSALRPAIHE
jgi:hypothetical protein